MCNNLFDQPSLQESYPGKGSSLATRLHDPSKHRLEIILKILFHRKYLRKIRRRDGLNLLREMFRKRRSKSLNHLLHFISIINLRRQTHLTEIRLHRRETIHERLVLFYVLVHTPRDAFFTFWKQEFLFAFVVVVSIFTPAEDVICKGLLFLIGAWDVGLCVDRVESADHEVLGGQLCGRG